MTEKNCCMQTLLSLNMSEFSLLFMEKLQPLLKMSTPLSQQPPSKN